MREARQLRAYMLGIRELPTLANPAMSSSRVSFNKLAISPLKTTTTGCLFTIAFG